jgi:hypothetical protein
MHLVREEAQTSSVCKLLGHGGSVSDRELQRTLKLA